MPVPNPSLRLLLIEGLADFFATEINGGDNYTHDLQRTDIFVAKTFARSDVVFPIVFIFEAVLANPEEREARQAGGNDDPALLYVVKFEINGWGKKGPDSNPAGPTYELMADVKKACGKLDSYVKDGVALNGVTIANVIHDPGMVLPASSVEGKTLNPMFVVQLGIVISESAADPYRLTD